jgi:hypothetical protein
MHPAWLRCESLNYLDIPALSRLARQAPQQLKMVIYFCANHRSINLRGGVQSFKAESKT